MAIYLDYLRQGNRLVAVAIRTGGTTRFLQPTEFDQLPGLLGEPGFIVVFKRPPAPIAKVLEPYPTAELNPIRPRWWDIFTILRKETEKEPALSKVAEATLGYGPQSEISDLPADEAFYASVELQNKMFDRLKILHDLFQFAENHGYLNFFYRDTQYTVGVDALERDMSE